MSELRRELVRRARAALELHRQASGRGAWLRDFAKEFDRAEEARVARSLARSMLSTRGGAQAEDKLTREVFEQLRKIPRDLVQFSRTTLDPEERRDKLLRRARLRAGQYERVSAMRRRRFALIDRGVRSYRWRSRRDGRVRDLHRELDSQIFDLRQGHPTQGHPGDSPGCRCSMVPIRRGLFKAAPAGARRAPPSGWEHIPGGKKGGFRKRKGNKWVYWYPEYKPSSRRGPPKKGEVEPRWGRKKQAPSDPKDIKIAQDEETARGHVKASVEILDRLPAGSSIITDDGETFTKDKDGWGRKNKGDRVHAHEMVEHIVGHGMVLHGAEPEKVEERFPFFSLLLFSLMAMVQAVVPGKDPHWHASMSKMFDAHKHLVRSWKEGERKREDEEISKVVKAKLEEEIGKLKLGDLSEMGLSEGLMELDARIKATTGAIKDLMHRHGQTPLQTHNMVRDLLTRRGWSEEARGEFLREVVAHKTLAFNSHSGLDAAENLAGGERVKPEQVREVKDFLGDGEFPDEVKELGEAAEKEIRTMIALFRGAKEDPEKAKEALAQLAASPAIDKLRRLALAYPGMSDKSIQDAHDVVAQAKALEPRVGDSTHGAEVNVFVPGDQGQPKALKAKYRLVEARDLIPSHDPETFSAHDKYPEGLQERAYHTDKAHQRDVQMYAQKIVPELFINTNPDAVNGAPIVTKEGIVLGGNSRTMAAQLAYSKHPKKGAEYKAYLRDQAHQFGLKSEDVEGLVNPVLVRELGTEDRSEDNLKRLVRQMNESFTKGMDERTKQVAIARKFTPETMNELANNMGADESLADYLKTDRSAGFLARLSKDGIIDGRNQSEFVTQARRGQKGGLLNARGRQMVEEALAGHIVGDADLMARLGVAQVKSLARSAPYITQALADGEDLRGPLKTALDAHATLQSMVRSKAIPGLTSKSSVKEIDEALNTMRSSLGFIDDHPIHSDDHARRLLHVLVKHPGVNQMSKVFKEYSSKSGKDPLKQTNLLGESDVLGDVLDKFVPKVEPKEDPDKPAEEPKEDGYVSPDEREFDASDLEAAGMGSLF